MAKKKLKPEVDSYCRNRVSKRIRKVTKMSPAHGWFQLDGGPGWLPWVQFTPVPKHIAEEELRLEKEKSSQEIATRKKGVSQKADEVA